MPCLALSALEVLRVVGLGLAGFLLVIAVCAVVLALLHAVLPSTDRGAEELREQQSEATQETRDGAGDEQPT